MIKMDHCGAKNGTDPDLYGAMSKALNATGRPVLFSLCSWGEDRVWQWGADIAQMYRVQVEISRLALYIFLTTASVILNRSN